MPHFKPEQKDDTFVYDLAKGFAELTACSVFLTGKAGTGKTTFLKTLKETTSKQMAVVAPTGVAAINAGGVTMHSFFQLPFTPFVPTPEGRKNLTRKIKMSSMRRKILQELELLVIDEISMVRADVLDEVDTVLRHIRHCSYLPFGGVQVIFIGDMYQLSPVVLEQEWEILEPYYESPYFFDSKVVKEQPPVYVEFDKIFRQKNEEFIDLLNQVRNDCLSEEGLFLLQNRCQPNFKPNKKHDYITLTTHNAKADIINASEMDKIKSKTHRFEAKINGEFPEKNYPNDFMLELKTGARVMFISNDMSFPRRYFNGKIGEVSRIEDGKIYVVCDEEEEIQVGYETWTNIRYDVNKQTKEIEEKELGTYTQYPLRLAWAITIHKSQGLTFEKAMIDIGNAFASGQVYVALSRCRSLEGMILLSEVNKHSLQVDNKIVAYGKCKTTTDELEKLFDHSKEDYNRRILFSVFDFNIGLAQVNMLSNYVEENAASFSPETVPFVKKLHESLIEINNVATKFRSQLEKLFSLTDKNHLSERITAATDYFNQQLTALIDLIAQSPAETDSKSCATEYNDLLKSFFDELSRKKHLLQGLKTDYSTANYFDLKKRFKALSFNVNAYAGVSSKQKSEHPELYRMLQELRSLLCEEENLPVYRVFQTKSLLELTAFLPQTLADLKQIYGFGDKKIEKYGQQVLDVVTEYCYENKLQSRMNVIQKERTKKPKREEKPEKKHTRLITYDLYKTGKTIEEIAVERQFVTGTIETHLAFFVKNGTLSLYEFVSEAEAQEAIRLFELGETISSVFNSCHGNLSYGQLRMILAHMEREK